MKKLNTMKNKELKDGLTKPEFNLRKNDFDPPKFDAQALISERGEARGDFHEVAVTAQSLKYIANEALDKLANPDMKDDECEALDNIFTKIARIIHRQTPDDLDSWKDIAGYATLVVNRILKDKTERGEIEL